RRFPPQIQIWLRLRRKRKLEEKDEKARKRARLLTYTGERNKSRVGIQRRRRNRARRTAVQPEKTHRDVEQEQGEISNDHGDAVEEPIEPERPSQTVTPEQVVGLDNINRTVEDNLEDDVRSTGSTVRRKRKKRKYGSGVGDKGRKKKKPRVLAPTEQNIRQEVVPKKLST